jgi:hypothetical protein
MEAPDDVNREERDHPAVSIYLIAHDSHFMRTAIL